MRRSKTRMIKKKGHLLRRNRFMVPRWWCRNRILGGFRRQSEEKDRSEELMGRKVQDKPVGKRAHYEQVTTASRYTTLGSCMEESVGDQREIMGQVERDSSWAEKGAEGQRREADKIVQKENVNPNKAGGVTQGRTRAHTKAKEGARGINEKEERGVKKDNSKVNYRLPNILVHAKQKAKVGVPEPISVHGAESMQVDMRCGIDAVHREESLVDPDNRPPSHGNVESPAPQKPEVGERHNRPPDPPQVQIEPGSSCMEETEMEEDFKRDAEEMDL